MNRFTFVVECVETDQRNDPDGHRSGNGANTLAELSASGHCGAGAVGLPTALPHRSTSG